MALYNETNMIHMIESSLAHRIKKAVTDKLVEEELERFEKQVRERIEPIVESITLEGVTKMAYLVNIRDELRIYVKVNKNEPVKTT